MVLTLGKCAKGAVKWKVCTSAKGQALQPYESTHNGKATTAAMESTEGTRSET